MTGPARTRRILLLASAVALAVGACSSSDTTPTTQGTVAAGTAGARSTRGADVARPEVTGPVRGAARPANAMPEALAAERGYVEEEFLVAGEATSYVEAGPWGTDGRWAVEPSATAPYATRILVRRPADPAAFDGTVVVEWLNVSSGQDVDVVFGHTHDELLAHGTAWVGVSAQRVGVEGGGNAFEVPGVDAQPLVEADPERYGTLVHPGDDFSYDIYSQAAQALLRPDGADPLGGLVPEQLIAAGESQSAARMVTYVDAIQPVAEIFDGFLIHSRSDGGSVLQTTDPVEQPAYAHIRDDLDVPVLQFETETDIFGLPFVEARQPDTPLLRTWEVAGTAHLDRGMVDYQTEAAGATGPPPGDPLTASCGRINEGPQGPVLRAALAALRTWVVDGTAPPSGEPLAVVDGAIERDELGVAVGGIRTPPVDAPVVVLRGDNPTAGSYICALFGSTAPLDEAVLATRYPTPEAYVAAVTASAEAAEAAGFLLEADAAMFVDAAEASGIGG